MFVAESKPSHAVVEFLDLPSFFSVAFRAVAAPEFIAQVGFVNIVMAGGTLCFIEIAPMIASCFCIRIVAL